MRSFYVFRGNIGVATNDNGKKCYESAKWTRITRDNARKIKGPVFVDGRPGKAKI